MIYNFKSITILLAMFFVGVNLGFANYTINLIQPSIADNDGQIVLQLGDAKPYDISISPLPDHLTNLEGWVDELAVFDGLSHGTYIITLVDCTGCTYEETVTLDEKMCDLSVLVENIQNNTVPNGAYFNAEIRLRLQPDPHLDDYLITWMNEAGETFRTNTLYVSGLSEGMYTVHIEHISNPSCHLVESYQIVDCSSSQIVNGVPTSQSHNPNVQFRILNITPPTTSSTTDGSITYTIFSDDGTAFVEWPDLNMEAIATSSGITNLAEGTFSYIVNNGCYPVEHETITVLSCNDNLQLTGSLVSSHVPDCETVASDEDGVLDLIYELGYESEDDFNTSINVRVSFNTNLPAREFITSNIKRISIRGLPAEGYESMSIGFSDPCGRTFIDEVLRADLIHPSSLRCDDFQRDLCGNEFTNSYFRFTADKDFNNFIGHIFDKPNINFDKDYRPNWRFCNARIVWPFGEGELLIERQEDGTYTFDGKDHADLPRETADYNVAVSINDGECQQNFQVAFGASPAGDIWSSSFFEVDHTFGYYSGTHSILPKLYYSNRRRYAPCVSITRSIGYIFFPNDLENPCDGGGFYRKYDYVSEKFVDDFLTIVPANTPETIEPEFINFDYDLPLCSDGNISYCLFYPGTVSGIPAGDELYTRMWYCKYPDPDDEVIIDPECGDYDLELTNVNTCESTIVCENGDMRESVIVTTLCYEPLIQSSIPGTSGIPPDGFYLIGIFDFCEEACQKIGDIVFEDTAEIDVEPNYPECTTLESTCVN